MRLRSTLALTFGTLALVASLAGATLVEHLASTNLRDQTGQDLAALSGRLRDQLDHGMHERWRHMQVLATVARTTSATPEARRAWIEALQRAHDHYSWIGFVTQDGTVTASTRGMLQGVSVAARPWFKAALQGPHAGDVHEAMLLAKMLPASVDGGPLRFVDVAAPLVDAEGAPAGVLGAHVSWDWARSLAQGVIAEAGARMPGLEALILRADGEVILGPAGLQGQRLPAGTVPDGSAGRPAHAVVSFDGATSHLVGAARSLGVDDYPGLGWTILVRQPSGLAFAAADATRRQIMLAGGAFALLLAGAGWWTAGRIGRPLLALADAAQRIEQRGRAGGGDALPQEGEYAEVDVLTRSLRTLLARLAERDAALAQANTELESRVDERTRALARSEALAHSIVDASPDCVKVLDLDGRVTFINGTGVCLLELDDALQVGDRNLATLWPEEDRGAISQRIARAAEGEVQRFTTVAQTAKGRTKWWDISLTPIPDANGRPGRILAVSRDITALKSAENELILAKEEAERQRSAAESASEAKTEFLASMSHEIRTPLNGVLGYAEVLLDDAAEPLTAQQRRTAERIQSAGAALLTIVNDILDFSKIEAGEIDLEPQPFDLASLVDNTLSIVGGLATRKRLALDVRIDPGLPTTLLGDQDRLRQVLLNLLNNAVKFTPMGGVTLAIGPVAGGRDLVRFAVTDTGIGIPAEKHARLFQRFSQVDGSVRREYGGTGLGLAISQRLVALMDGEIGVISSAGQGSTFWFTARLPATERALAVAAPSDEAPAVRPARILLVEDLPMNQDLARLVLEAAGHSVDVVGDGADAVMAVQARAYDVVLMDIQMPGMDGIAATRHIRALEGPVSGVPIVALTANVLPAQIAEFRQAGMNGHAGKPFKRAQLLAAVERCRGWDASTAEEAVDAPVAFDEPVLAELIDLVGAEQVAPWLRQLRAELERGVPGDDGLAPAALQAWAHALVSRSGTLGFRALSTAARDLEEACREGRGVAACREALAGHVREAVQTLAALERRLATARTAAVA